LEERQRPVPDVAALYAEHQPAVFRYLCRTVGQADAARDLTQEVFLRVSRARVPEADASGLRAWVFAIARNLALNHLRDGRVRTLPVAPPSATPAVQELAVAMQQALDALQELDRDVFLMREVGGLSYQEIARACELSIEAVRARLKRARQDLRVALDGPVRVHRLRTITLGGDSTGEG
jgi:RNA polymerase sigma factor (sigma-70 family)